MTVAFIYEDTKFKRGDELQLRRVLSWVKKDLDGLIAKTADAIGTAQALARNKNEVFPAEKETRDQLALIALYARGLSDILKNLNEDAYGMLKIHSGTRDPRLPYPLRILKIREEAPALLDPLADIAARGSSKYKAAASRKGRRFENPAAVTLVELLAEFFPGKLSAEKGSRFCNFIDCVFDIRGITNCSVKAAIRNVLKRRPQNASVQASGRRDLQKIKGI